MALAANSMFRQILKDTSNRGSVVWGFHSANGENQSTQLAIEPGLFPKNSVINFTIVDWTNPTAISGSFVPGELVTWDGGNGSAYVAGWTPATNTLLTILKSGLLPNISDPLVNTTIVGNLIKSSATITAAETPKQEFDVVSLSWNVTGSAKVELGWILGVEPTTNGYFTLAGTGYLGRNELPAFIRSPNSEANLCYLYATTHGMTAGGGYTIVAEIKKRAGWGEFPIY